MATPEIVIPVKRHSHPVLGGLSLAALVLSCVALAKACPPVPAPAAAPAAAVDKPITPAPAVVPAVVVPAPVAIVPVPPVVMP